jgi:hypothetical protein
MFGWHETVKFLTMPTPLLDAWKIFVELIDFMGLSQQTTCPKDIQNWAAPGIE